MFERVFRQFSLIFSKGTIVTSTPEGAQVRFFPGEVHDDIPFIAPYGLASRAPNNARCLVVSNGDRESAGIIAAVAGPPRELQAGEVELYSSGKSSVKLSEKGVVITGDKIVVENGGGDLIHLIGEILKVLCESPDANAIPAQAKALLKPLKEKWK